MPERFDYLKVGLEHGRALFVYHAGQRHTSLNFYFVALAAFVPAFVALFTQLSGVKPPILVPAIATTLGIAAITVARLFYLLDWRNATLVDIDEKLVERMESELATLLAAGSTGPLDEVKTIERSERVEPKWRRYGNLVPAMLKVFAALSGLTIVDSWIHWWYLPPR